VSMAAHKSLFPLLILLCALFSAAQPLRAQQEPQPLDEKPKPAGAAANPIPLVGMGAQDQEPIPALEPDVAPLTGVQTPTLGSPPVLHSYWEPGIQWSGSFQSNPYNQTPTSSWVMNNFLAGTLSMLKVWSGSQLALNYSAGGYVSTDSTQGNGYYHQLAFSQTFQWRRMSIALLDQFSYLPQSSFGFGGGTGLGLPGTGGTLGPVTPGLGNNYVPNQTIYAAVGARYSNAASVQLTYTTSPRGSITLSGSYGLLNFVQPGNVDSDMTTGTIGYNYNLTPKDSIGAFYRFTAFHFSGQPEAYGDHSANVAYSRKLAGRLVVQLYTGPDFTASRVVSPGGNSLTHGVNAGANLNYGFESGGITAGYSHGIFGGSGVVAGSTSDLINFGANHKLGRIWSGQINMGYAHNSPLANSPFANFPQAVTQSFNTWNAGGGVYRALGRNATLAIAYNATITNYGLAGCVGAACSSSQTLQFVTVNFQWHTRPFVLL
jgi:hypothetical protein